jgi:hypothetical protein
LPSNVNSGEDRIGVYPVPAKMRPTERLNREIEDVRLKA